jgi:hypothetical protein
MAKDNKGLRTYDGVEGLNASLGQAGFKVLDTSGDSTGTGNFIAFQILGDGANAASIEVAADTLVGDNIGEIDSTYIEISAGNTVYGPFKEIKISTVANAVLLAYNG